MGHFSRPAIPPALAACLLWSAAVRLSISAIASACPSYSTNRDDPFVQRLGLAAPDDETELYLVLLKHPCQLHGCPYRGYILVKTAFKKLCCFKNSLTFQKSRAIWQNWANWPAQAGRLKWAAKLQQSLQLPKKLTALTSKKIPSGRQLTKQYQRREFKIGSGSRARPALPRLPACPPRMAGCHCGAMRRR